MKRATLNLGVRFEYFNAMIEEQAVEAGRFAPARTLNEIPDMPQWFDVAPRLGLSYDLFGTAKTALKASFGKYMEQSAVGFPARYNPLQLQFETRSWADRNGDDIAQDNEIGNAVNQRFGLPVQTLRPDPNIGREYDLVYNAGVQHELRRGLAVTANYYRRGAYNLRRTENTLLTLNDYTPLDIVNPYNGEPLRVYSLNREKFGFVDRIDRTNNDSDLRRRTYNGLELGFNARFTRGSAFGGYTFDRLISVNCDGSNADGTQATDPNSLRYCDQSQLDVPMRHELKFAGSYTLPWQDIQLNAAFQSYSGVATRVTWNLTPTLNYPAVCPGACEALAGTRVVPTLTQPSLVVDLIPPGTELLSRHNQLDFGIRKLFRVRAARLSAQVDIFNLLNSSRINTWIEAFGPTFRRPTAILQPRTLRLAMQMRF